ncbi:hypothetical protein [Nocardioides massiliensis]|uniref:Esterase-like activity of phytase family protein n=1 Tax=Nocardioides massiliensis TaxID=1325935 RepID=A0ABT9NP54_9ACTN|nr:hypothetical protein [Nocardioides massiliensis]MDP9822153.1 hypothetical protein [Nocardioides massiliensis]
MTRTARAGLAAVLAAVALAPAAAATAQPAAEERAAFTDERIDESSGLVDLGDVVVTVNDSGDDAIVYVVDLTTGDTVGTTVFADSVVDVEALAPAGDVDGEPTVWVGDIGDNAGRRPDIRLYRVPVGRGDREVAAPAYRLVYPDRAQDAETLLVHPDTGRVLIVTKSLFGGTVYVAPKQLRTDRLNRLRPVTRVSGFLTDGAFWPDGRHVVLRDYGAASLLTYPGFERLGEIALPEQEQGEAISVGADGRVLVSTEGRYSVIHEVRLPPALVPSTEPGLESVAEPESVTDDEEAESAAAPEVDPATGLLDGPAVPVAVTLAGLLIVGLVLRRRS